MDSRPGSINYCHQGGPLMRYALLLRGINVGGKNKIVMSELIRQVEELGYSRVTTYINSGNLFFNSDRPESDIIAGFKDFFANLYPFVLTFALLSAKDFAAEDLPDWWGDDLARKDVLFYTVDLDRELVQRAIEKLELADEIVHFGELGIYWGKYQEKTFLKTTYHKALLKQPFYKAVTIRNHKTYAKLADYLELSQDCS